MALIYPLNLSSHLPRVFTLQDIHARLGLVAGVVTIDQNSGSGTSVPVPDIQSLTAKIEEMLQSGSTWLSRLCPTPATELEIISAETTLDPALKILLHPSQIEWCVGGRYPVIGYADRERTMLCTPEKIATGMLLLDRWLIDYGTADPDQYAPMIVEPDTATAYESAISDEFLNGGGLWRERLVNPRTIAQVMLRALLLSRDPETELQSFIASGGYVFTDYLRCI